MEDAHIADDKVVDKVAVFGVFDGHGGNKYNIYIIFTIIWNRVREKQVIKRINLFFLTKISKIKNR